MEYHVTFYGMMYDDVQFNVSIAGGPRDRLLGLSAGRAAWLNTWDILQVPFNTIFWTWLVTKNITCHF